MGGLGCGIEIRVKAASGASSSISMQKMGARALLNTTSKMVLDEHNHFMSMLSTLPHIECVPKCRRSCVIML